ncbi:MAG: FtsQ-type POTRA domain-containing protein [Candidatus Aminicenantes bacterium]|nr:FtsQ-type POTRA domain-containing protein [Candidatus Aminicenantes bacterium]
MATNLNPAFKYRSNILLSRPTHFRRGNGKIKTKKIQRKIRLKLKHILFTFFLLGGIFYSIQQFYLFLISWDKLNVKEIEVVCHRQEIKEEIQQILKGEKLGNILLLNIGHLQEGLTKHRWIKEVLVRKNFPSSLKIELIERTPYALLKKEKLFLIDADGVQLEQIYPNEKMNLPLLVDSNNFEKNYEEKLKLAWECLEGLKSSEKEQIDLLDLSDYENVSIRLKESQTWLILGNDQYAEKLRLFRQISAKLEKQGALEYVDLRFEDRLYIKPIKNLNEDNFKKEAN